MLDIGEQVSVPPDFTKKEKQTGMWWRHLVCGGVAGVISRTVSAPLDRLKVLMQVHGAKMNIGVIGGLKYMVKEGGVKSLWRGNGVNCVKVAPEYGIRFMAFDLVNVHKFTPHVYTNLHNKFTQIYTKLYVDAWHITVHSVKPLGFALQDEIFQSTCISIR